ncbi:amidohydrolase family protein [Aeromonas caviae]|uniref:hypothetical protein n=1 Tax=Aeromonas caviae TaxID=648 RepID=UPI002B45B0E8|nr:hypothetical protein [Aeromonas caviae]
MLEVHFLNSSELLNYLSELPLRTPVEPTRVKHGVFLSFHEANRFQPDHVLEKKWSGLEQYQKEHNLELGPILVLHRIADEYFCCEKVGSRIKLAQFSRWQTIMTRLSCLPLHAWYQTTHPQRSPRDKDAYGYRWPIYPYHPYVEDYIGKEGLHETHQHLNGSSSAEDCWLDALHQPKLTYAKFAQEYQHSDALQQLVAQIDPSLRPATLLERLQLAKSLREFLAMVALGQDIPKEIFKLDTPWQLVEINIPVHWPTTTPYQQQAEHWLLCTLFKRWQEKAEPHYERLLWLYLLIQHQFLNLLVQRDDFFGFDQFQKYTFTELRERTELQYLQRFRQVHGCQTYSQVGYLEGRFAPKKSQIEMEVLLVRILGGYLEYLSGQKLERPLSLSQILNELDKVKPEHRPAQLALVVHFIKKRDEGKGHYPFERLYRDLATQGALLLNLLRRQPKLGKWLRGIDAASNEMHTPPEVFAPLFRVLHHHGIEHMSYHVGEDFPHLLSGIRAIDDALRFLPLRSGDRLGHCTAIGITPNIWQRSMPTQLEVSQETRLLDLVFIWRELRNNQAYLKWAYQAASEAITLAMTILNFDIELSIDGLDTLLSMRGLYPASPVIFNGDTLPLRATGMWDEELERAVLIEKKQPRMLEFYRLWLMDTKVRQAREKQCTISIDHYPSEILIALQQQVMTKIADRNIAIECPPTSNTRISQYREVTEHHVFRWMGLPEARLSGDIPMSICLGSDDPGIFAADLKSEFYHLFSVLIGRFHLSPEDALERLAKLNENGRIYRFHAQNVYVSS